MLPLWRTAVHPEQAASCLLNIQYVATTAHVQEQRVLHAKLFRLMLRSQTVAWAVDAEATKLGEALAEPLKIIQAISVLIEGGVARCHLD